MPCIVALPDGTYMIVNGAHQGVAGFGLASDPNLSALLYDPSQPVGSRFSILGNTTIARMYHSEATLLPDGRVLISGSDPQTPGLPEELRIHPAISNPLAGVDPARRDRAEGRLGIRRALPDQRALVPGPDDAHLARCGGVEHARQYYVWAYNLPGIFMPWFCLHRRCAAQCASLAPWMASAVCPRWPNAVAWRLYSHWWRSCTAW
jgi:hypothetical protein